MLTVYENTELIFQALTAGASGYMLKQTPPGDLLAAMRDVHKGGSPMSSHIARKVVASFQQSGASAKELESLTAREQEVLNHLAKGFLYKEIAEAMTISYDGPHAHPEDLRKAARAFPHGGRGQTAGAQRRAGPSFDRLRPGGSMKSQGHLTIIGY
jgi:FixJ family two-component response regulator